MSAKILYVTASPEWSEAVSSHQGIASTSHYVRERTQSTRRNDIYFWVATEGRAMKILTQYDPAAGYSYVIVSTRGGRDLKNFTGWQTLYTIERDGNVFTIVKQRPIP